MAKIIRYNGNLVPFASASLGTERTVFGDVTQADDITSQYTADFLRGWGIVGPSDQPTLQDFNAVSYTHGQILAYLHQVGVPEYNAAQEYHIGSFANVSGVLYVSITNSNTGNDPASSPSQWKAQTQNGLSRFTASGSFTVPAGVTQIFVSGCASGAGGGSGASNSGGQSSLVGGGGGGGGGAGQSIAVTPGQVINITLGPAGTGGEGPVTSGAGSTGTSGANAVIGSLITLAGGSPGGGGGAVTSNAIGGGGAGGSAGAGSPAGGAGSDGNYAGTGGGGASCPFGGGGANGRAAISTANANAAGTGSGFGSGGGGGGGGYGSALAQYGGSGGAGAPAIVIIEW